MSAHGTVRYSDEELAEFRQLIETKWEEAQNQLQTLQEQILEITENAGDEHGGDWMDDSNVNNDVEMLNTMAIRQRKYIKDLENALVRIKNKTYGICVITGELIDKRRLMAVPTTTKSVMAKSEEQRQVEEKTQVSIPKQPYVKTEEGETPPPPAPTGPKIITRVIRKPSSAPAPKPAAPKAAHDDDDDLDIMGGMNDDYEYDSEDDNESNESFDFDNYADNDSFGEDY